MRLSPPAAALLGLTIASLACTTAEVPITPGGAMFTPQLAPPTPTSAIPTRTPTVTRSPTPTIFITFTPSPTPPGFAPFPNGSFENDLAGWTLSDPAQVTWQEGYARLPTGTFIQLLSNAPQGLSVGLHLRARSEDVGEGTCALDIPSLSNGYDFAHDNQWYDLEFDVTSLNGLPVTVNPTAGGSCPVVHIDDIYWVVTSAGVAASETPTLDPNAQPTATLGPTDTPAPLVIPPEAQRVAPLSVTNEGGTLQGKLTDMFDGNTQTWAALRNGNANWILELGGLRRVAGLTLYAQRVSSADTLLVGIDVSNDAQSWTPVYVPATACGSLSNCQTLTQGALIDLPFPVTQAAYIRLRGGPATFGFAEIQVAILP